MATFVVFMEDEDSAEGLVKVATCEEVYAKLAAKVKNMLLSRMFMPDFYILN